MTMKETENERKIICAKCGADTVHGNMVFSEVWRLKGKGILVETQRSPISCHVCPECGYCELYADKPEVFT